LFLALDEKYFPGDDNRSSRLDNTSLQTLREIDKQMVDALDMMREAWKLDPAPAAPPMLSFCLHRRARFLAANGMMQAAEEARREAIEVFHKIPFMKWREEHKLLFSKIAFEETEYLRDYGRLNEAAELCLDILGRKPGRERERDVCRLLVNICITKNDLEAAEACAQKMLTKAAEIHPLEDRHYFIAESKLLLANVAEARGELEMAVRLDDEAQEICQGDVSRTMKLLSTEAFNVTRRKLLFSLEQGEWKKALGSIGSIMKIYKDSMDKALTFIAYGRLAPLRKLLRAFAVALRHTGQEAKADAVEREVDEDDLIFSSLRDLALEELREEMQKEGRGGAGGATATTTKKKKNRKQQKRKAAKLKKQQEQQAQEEKEEGTQLAAAAGSLSLDEGKEEKEEEAAPTQAAAAEEEEPEECGVCLDVVLLVEEEEEEGEDEKCADEAALLLICSHVFHRRCLSRWQVKCDEKSWPLTCPMCRGPLVEMEGAKKKKK
jgi:tetratricopeptide (TPR) repeat protein